MGLHLQLVSSNPSNDIMDKADPTVSRDRGEIRMRSFLIEVT
jgi:hypothetical protein